ncbi:ArsR family transcriptional regulator [Haloarcula sp. S1AR25-5A]|uniref:ArsR family transcriptional regulator n=1 Tax=Haloarcula terrestris TaxID=2950533 RepID=A0AAE4EVC1_9EURY|nr:ArsR family transcriptional regulator [Haloarcula terrestris]MDS0220840.1 ArsR family transcriptional regulator [Haloarcula terrestris]
MSNQRSGNPRSDQWCGMTPSDRTLSTAEVDDVFEVLADWRRRAVCHYFATGDQTATDVETLATAVSKKEARSTNGGASTSPSTIRTQLEEEHLPILHRIGLIDYDERSGAVKYWGSPTVEKWADHAEAVTRRTDF